MYDYVNYRSDFILDVKTVSVVNGHGLWTPAFHTGKINIGFTLKKVVKNRKHGPFYTPIAFLPFVTSYVGSFAPTSTRLLLD